VSTISTFKAHRTWLLGWGAVVYFVYLFHFAPNATASDRFVSLAVAMVEHGTVRVDDSPVGTDELVEHAGRLYINANPGLSFLATPAWAVARPLFVKVTSGTALDRPEVHAFAAHFVCFASTTAALGAAAAVLLALSILQETKSVLRALCGSGLYAFGSIAFFFSSRLQQNVVITFLAAGALTIWIEWARLDGKPPWSRLAVFGVALGLGLFVDLSAAPLVLVAVVMVSLRYGLRRGAALVAGVALGTAPLLGYLWTTFGNAFLPPQAYLEGTIHDVGLWGLTWPTPGSLASLLVSPRQGLLVFMPYTLFALSFLAGGSERNGTCRGFVASTTAAYLLFAASMTSSRYNLFGPRYLLPVIPLLCFAVAVAFGPRLRRPVLVLGALGLLVNGAGAQLGHGSSSAFSTVAVWVVRGPWLPIVDWIQGPLQASTGLDVEVVTPYGFLILLLGLTTPLAVLTLPWSSELLGGIRRSQSGLP
jgi:hypothetical protein